VVFLRRLFEKSFRSASLAMLTRDSRSREEWHMQGHAKDPVVRRRALRAGIRGTVTDERPSGRVRRGALTILPSAWRRTAPGTNHIACFGVWRAGTRREAERPNRAGATRWHMPFRHAPAFGEGAAAIQEEVVIQ
jgi:hypothetical protein